MRARLKITEEELERLRRKKYVRYKEGAVLYSVGLHTFERWAREAGAIRRPCGRTVLVNLEKIDEYLEMFGED